MILELEALKLFAIKEKIPEPILLNFLNTAFVKASEKLHPNRKLFFDVKNEIFYESINNEIIEFPLKSISTGRFILLARSNFLQHLIELNPIKYNFKEKINFLTRLTEVSLQKNKQNEKNNIFVDKEKQNHKEYFEDGKYCASCQESPCMCSDPELTSSVLDF